MRGNSGLDARGRALRIEDRPRAGGKHCLHDVSLGHRAFAACEEALDVRQRCLIQLQRNAKHCRQGIPREIIGRRSQAAGGDHDIGPFNGRAEHANVGLQIIGHRRVIEHAHAQLAEPLAEPLAVGVEPLPRGELVAYGDDFGLHLRNVNSPRCQATSPARGAVSGTPLPRPSHSRGCLSC